ncbi:Uncharacterised protein [Serratia rubidaea]|uniref:Uncharacterized protein n=1 Tax=Serratia rubidaea TaxID=61652 RepID=A0A447QL25_SERRU|nr:Uncharacterised protein [Serratia rubidaea]
MYFTDDFKHKHFFRKETVSSFRKLNIFGKLLLEALNFGEDAGCLNINIGKI